MERELRTDDNLLRSAFSVREVVRLVNAVSHMPIAQEMANAYLDLLYQKKSMMDAAQIHRLTDDIVTGKYGGAYREQPAKEKAAASRAVLAQEEPKAEENDTRSMML